MTLKERLEYIWKTGPCVCPCHITSWNFIGRGWRWILAGPLGWYAWYQRDRKWR